MAIFSPFRYPRTERHLEARPAQRRASRGHDGRAANGIPALRGDHGGDGLQLAGARAARLRIHPPA